MKQKTLQFNFISYLKVIFLCLLLTGGISFAQTQSATEEIQEDHDTKNLDKVLKDYNQDSEQVLKDAEKLLPKGTGDDTGELTDKELGDGPVLDPDDESSLEGKNRAGFFDPKLYKKRAEKSQINKDGKTHHAEDLRVQLSVLQKLPEKELIKLLLEQTRKSEMGHYIERYPKLAVYTVRLVKDKDALPDFVGILDNIDKLIRFAGVMIATILVGFFLKRLMKREGRPVWKAVLYWFFRFCLLTSLRLAILLFFYGKEITPIFKIASKTFFNE